MPPIDQWDNLLLRQDKIKTDSICMNQPKSVILLAQNNQIQP